MSPTAPESPTTGLVPHQQCPDGASPVRRGRQRPFPTFWASGVGSGERGSSQSWWFECTARFHGSAAERVVAPVCRRLAVQLVSAGGAAATRLAVNRFSRFVASPSFDGPQCRSGSVARFCPCGRSSRGISASRGPVSSRCVGGEPAGAGLALPPRNVRIPQPLRSTPSWSRPALMMVESVPVRW